MSDGKDTRDNGAFSDADAFDRALCELSAQDLDEILTLMTGRPEPCADTEPHAQAEPFAWPEPRADAEPHAQAEPFAWPEPRADAEPHAQAEPFAWPEPQDQSESHAQAKPPPWPEPVLPELFEQSPSQPEAPGRSEPIILEPSGQPNPGEQPEPSGQPEPLSRPESAVPEPVARPGQPAQPESFAHPALAEPPGLPEQPGVETDVRPEPVPRDSALRRELFEWVRALVSAIVFVSVLSLYFVRIIGVSGSSMDPTLSDGQKLLISNLFYRPVPGDVLIFTEKFGEQQPIDGREPLVKRVIAIEGQTVDIDFDTGEVWVDNKLLEEPYIMGPTNMPGNMEFPLSVPPGHMFMMGDNRNDSLDSRWSVIGMVDERYVLGHVLMRVWPLGVTGKI